MKQGFTLVELAIVLVIIGLIVGGVLVGRDLIAQAEMSAQLSQVSKFNAATNTFRVKYGALPGDIPSSKANQFGFAARGTLIGQGDGDGIIAGGTCCTADTGEGAMFWADLSKAGLVSGNFNTASSTTPPGADVTGAAINNYIPQAKLGKNSVYVLAGGYYGGSSTWYFNGRHYYGISNVTSLSVGTPFGWINSSKGITALQASSMDNKIDDGLPEYGAVLSLYANGIGGQLYWSDGTYTNVNPPQAPDTVAITASATTCYDNAGVSANIKKYTTAINDGAGVNCGLSFRFQ